MTSANGLFHLKRRRKSKNIRQLNQYTDPNSDLKNFSGPEFTHVQFKGAVYSSHTRLRMVEKTRERKSDMKKFEKFEGRATNSKYI